MKLIIAIATTEASNMTLRHCQNLALVFRSVATAAKKAVRESLGTRPYTPRFYLATSGSELKSGCVRTWIRCYSCTLPLASYPGLLRTRENKRVRGRPGYEATLPPFGPLLPHFPPSLPHRLSDGEGGAEGETQGGEDEDDDIVLGQVQRSFKCPLTRKYLEDPVTSAVCKHSYSRAAILEHIRKSAGKRYATTVPLPL